MAGLTSVKLVQKELRELVRVVLPPHPVDLGKFTTVILGRVLKDVKKELGLDFDELEVHPGPHPRESADIELIKEGVISRRINVKTCVSGDLKVTLRRLVDSIRLGEDGAVVVFALCHKGKSVEARMIIALIPEEALRKYGSLEIYDVIQGKIKEKTVKEGYDVIEPLAVNDAIELERARTAIEAYDHANKAYKEVKEAKEESKKIREEARQAREEARKAYEEARHAREEARQAREEARKAYEEARHAREIIEKKLDAILDKLSG
ncbi:MAG: hypothetical protein ACTSWP_11155 [Candidatus Freyarchaeota archaeon]